jgi:NAD(P)-dependent dehydrogenase (short-subunit alcohol dehydrogenase family)
MGKTKNFMKISGKKAVVFGGTSGIGLAIVKMLAQEGASVVAISRDPSKSGPLPGGVTTKSCDVRDSAAVERLLNEIGMIDILVSAATGGKRAFGPFVEMDMDGFKGSFDKLWGYANVVRFGARHMSDEGSITLLSGSPARTFPKGLSALSSVGGAVEALVRTVAKEVAPRIRVNVVSPGLIDTPMYGQTDQAKRAEDFRDMSKGNLIPRAGTADEVAEGVMFVIKNDFVTGTIVDVDGGSVLS